MFRSINGPSSGPQELRSTHIHMKFMEVLQVLQFEIKLYIFILYITIYIFILYVTIKSNCLLLYIILFQIVKPKGSHRVATLP